MKHGLTPSELGSMVKAGAESVKMACREGRISRECWEIYEGRYLITDPERACREFIEHRKRQPGPGRPAKEPADGGKVAESLYKHQTEHEKWKVKERKEKVKRQIGASVDKKAAERRWTELFRGMSERILNWPADAAGRLAAKHGIDAATFEIDLEAEMRTLLAGMTAESLTVGTARERAA